MKILMISTDRNILHEGSAARMRMVEYGGLVEELHIVIFTKRTGAAPLQISNNVSVYPTNSLNRWLYIFDALHTGGRILRHSTFHIPHSSLISCQDPFETGLVGALLKRRFAVPLQIQIHTDFLSPYFAAQSILNRLRVFVAKFVLTQADGIRVVSKRIKDSLATSTSYTLHSTLVTVLPIFVAAERFAKPQSAHFPFPKTILVVSRLAPEKNVALAIRAFAGMAQNVPNAGLLIAGDGPEAKKLHELAQSLGLEKRVQFMGAVASTELPALYAAADCFLSTSNYEGYGMALVEAASAGLPIVTTDVGIVGEMVRDEQSALVCPVGDAMCLSQKLDRVLRDTILSQKLGEAAAASAHEAAMSKAVYMEHINEGWKMCVNV
jgi:glycosyltransferase involved in cell wall biosynthesis